MPDVDIQPAAPVKPKRMVSVSTLIILVLLAVIAGLLWYSKPWQGAGYSDRTISVTGTAKITAEPDEFVFLPSYEFKNADKAKALDSLTKKSEEIVKKLKELGVPDNKIKTNANGNDYIYYYDVTAKTNTYTLQFTITLTDKALSQKVQDYLVTTTPTGNVSPQASFSEAKRKELESQARDGATKEARSKAEQSAKNLGFKIGKVKSVDDGAGFGGIIPLGRDYISSGAAEDTSSKLSIQPGENDLNYTVTVVYFVR